MAEAPFPKLPRLEAIQNNAKARKVYHHFMYKAVIVSIFLVIVPLLSSQALDFVNQNIHSRRRELLQLTFVGIVVSYGLFSKRSEESEQEKENSSTFDNAHSYISRLLHVPSVFDDETENPSAFDENNKIQTWNSQYYRGEPMVVIAKEDCVHQEQMRTSSFVGEKPLLLPVRSLTSRISDNAHLSEPIQTGFSHRPLSGSDWLPNSADEPMSPVNFQEDEEQNVVKRSGSKRFSREGKQTRNQESGGLSTMKEMETTSVHRSTIPWRTRSGRMVFEDDINGCYTQNSGEDTELNKLKSSSLFKSLSSLSSRIDLNPPSPNKEASSPVETSPLERSPSPSLSGEAQEKRIEDFLRKNSLNKFSPLQPHPPYLHKSSPSVSGSREIDDQISETRELRRSIRSVPMEFNENKRVEVTRRGNSWSEFRATENQHDGSNTRRSVRTTRQRDTFGKTRSANEFRQDFYDEELKKWSKAIEEFFGDKKEFTSKMVHEKLPSESRQTFLELPEAEEIQEFAENGIVDTEEDSETQIEDDFFDGNIGLEDRLGKEVEEVGASLDSTVDGGPDVDKKADEFIAKFREQIRLQRIQSIRRSSTP